MNPYLSGGLCRMTKQAVLAADQLMDHNLAISDHLPAALCALLFSTVLATKMQTRIAHRWKGYSSAHFIQCTTVYGSISFFCFGLLHIFS